MNIKTDWTKTRDSIPSIDLVKADTGIEYSNNDHLDCYIFINGNVTERPWNFYHKCWDDKDYDDFEFDARAPTHWMLKNPQPDAPTD